MTSGAAPLGRDPALTQQMVVRLRRRSLIVSFWRGALPTVIGVSILGMAIWAGVKTIGDLQPANRSAGEIRMIGPEFHGHDKKGRPYVVTAESAVRDPVKTDRSILTKPKLVMQTENRGDLTVTADSGLYDEASKVMDLTGNVVATDGQGYRFASPTAHVISDAHSVSGREGVLITGPLGQTSGSAYSMDDKAGHALIIGNVKTHLVPHAARH